jgi:hypothetical protein
MSATFHCSPVAGCRRIRVSSVTACVAFACASYCRDEVERRGGSGGRSLSSEKDWYFGFA